MLDASIGLNAQPMTSAPAVTRFAPSPTGLLHLGHAYSALFAAQEASARGGCFLLRIEDIDLGRCRPAFIGAIEEDLAWLGLDWPRPVRRQSEHFADYRVALDRLDAMGLLYRCFLSRSALNEALSAPHLAPRMGPDGPAVTDTDRLMDAAERRSRLEAGEHDRARIGRRADSQRAVHSATIGIAPLRGFASTEVRKEVVITPPLGARVHPCVVAGSMSPSEDHAVGARRTAECVPARHGDSRRH